MSKNINTMVVRDNTALNGVEIIFSDKASREIRKTLNGQYHKVKGYQSMTFRWNNDRGLWYATNCKSLKKQLDKFIKYLEENGYTDDEDGAFKGKHVKVKVIDERTVEPTQETAPTRTTTRRSNRRGGFRRSTATTTKAVPQTAPQAEEETVQTAPQTTTGASVNDVLLAIVQQNNTIIAMLNR